MTRAMEALRNAWTSTHAGSHLGLQPLYLLHRSIARRALRPGKALRGALQRLAQVRLPGGQLACRSKAEEMHAHCNPHASTWPINV